MCTTAIVEVDLINKVLCGERKAEIFFYEKYKQIVRDYIKHKYPSNYDVEDDVSDIMIKVFLKLKTFDKSKTQLKTWIINITKNHMIDKWRMNKVILVSGYDLVVEDGSFSTHYETTNMLNHLSMNIDPNDYVLLNMKYYDGYKICEIGNEFNISTSQMLNKISRIKKNIKERYKLD